MNEITLKIEGLDGIKESLATLCEILSKQSNIAVVPQAPQQAVSVVEEKTEPDVSITLTDIQKAFRNVATPENKQRLKELLAAYGASKVSDLNTKDYPDIIQKLELVANG